MQDHGRPVAEAVVDRGGEMGEAVGRELHVEVADRPRRLPGLGGGRRLLAAHPAQGAEDPGRVGGDRAEHRLAVLLDQALGPRRADVPQRGQVGDAAGAIGGVERQRAAGAELAAVAGVGLPLAADLGAVAGAEVGHRADEGEALRGLDVLDLEHRVAVVLGGKDHGDHLDRRRVVGRLSLEQCRHAAHRSRLAVAEAASPRPRPHFPANAYDRRDARAAPPRALRQLPAPAAGAQHQGLGFLALPALADRPRLPPLPAGPGPRLPRPRAAMTGARAGGPVALLAARRHRVGLAELGDVGRLVDRARLAADDQQADAVVAGPDLAVDAGADPRRVVLVERVAARLRSRARRRRAGS